MSPIVRRLVMVSLAASCGAPPAGHGRPPDAASAPPAAPGVDAAPAPPPPRPNAPADGGAPPTRDGPSPIPSDTGGPAPPPAGGRIEVTVAAGDLDRENSIVSFVLAPPARAAILRELQGGGRLPVQVDETGRATFVLPALKMGAQVVYALEEPSPGDVRVGATAVREADGVKLAVGGATVVRYQAQGKLPAGVGGAFLRGGYLHPLQTPAGVLVTDDYPSDHRHHHGVWSAWAHSTFEGRSMDFWNMGMGSAKVDFDGIAATWEGPVHAGVRARQVFVDLRATPQAKVALREEWVVTTYRTHDGTPPPYFVVDLDSTQEAATAAPVMLEDYTYGGFAFRGHAQWRSAVTFLTAEGRDRQGGDDTTTRWCHLGGRVDGKLGGYAVLGHPTNFRAPQPVRINPTDPYFSFSPVKAGGFPIAPGKPYVSRFRLVVSDGAADRALLDRLWSDYARPPMVTVRVP